MKYDFLTLKKANIERNEKLPEDVNEYVEEQLKKAGAFKDKKLSEMLKWARENCIYTDKTRAIYFQPKTKIPLATFEFHHGIIKQFSYAKFFTEHCYLPINLKNKGVIFKRGETHGDSRK